MKMQPNDLKIEGVEVLSPADQKAIIATIGRLFVGFARRDADMLEGVYTDDTDWINAFGSVKKGSPQIVEYLRGLFADDNFNEGAVDVVPTCSLRVLDADNVVVIAHLQITGQGLVGGGSIPLRDNRSVHVLSRQNDGGWRIVTELFQDARTDSSYINHS
ncbi:MAG: YybH family protein [Leucobacter sp.]